MPTTNFLDLTFTNYCTYHKKNTWALPKTAKIEPITKNNTWTLPNIVPVKK